MIQKKKNGYTLVGSFDEDHLVAFVKDDLVVVVRAILSSMSHSFLTLLSRLKLFF